MAVYEIPPLIASLVQVPIYATTVQERGLKSYLPSGAVYEGRCTSSESRIRNTVYLAELASLPYDNRFLLSVDGQTFFRPSIFGTDRRTEPRGPVPSRSALLRILGGLLWVNEKPKQPERNDAYQMLLINRAEIVLAFERGEPRLWRNIHRKADPFDSDPYFPGRAPSDALLAGGFSALAAQDAVRMLTAPKARFFANYPL